MTNPVWIAGGIGMFAIGAGGLEIAMALTATISVCFSLLPAWQVLARRESDALRGAE